MTPDDSIDAAELAVGLLDGTERADAMRRVLADRDFAAEVARWRAHFATLLDAVPAVSPPGELEARLMRAIDGGAGKWRWATGIATLMAAALAGILLLRPPETVTVRVPVAVPAPTPARAAALSAALAPTPDGGDAKPFVAIFDSATGDVRIAPTLDIPAGRDAELWRIGADGVPHSLGLLVAVGPTTIGLPQRDREALAAGTTLAVSIEPVGGSPSGKPTGPVVAAGALVRL